MKNRFLFVPLLIVFIAAGVLLPVSPVYRSIPSVDPSVYLYVGQQILQGGVPYRDAWDHKQPLLYLVYAFGQWITPGSLWGIWLVLWLAISAAALMFYYLLVRSGSRFLAFLSVTAGLLSLYPVLWGGSVEEFSIFFQAAVVLLLALILSTGKTRLQLAYGAGLGVCVAGGFFLKQNLIAAGLVALIYLLGVMLLKRRWHLWGALAAAAGGAAVVAASFALYLGLSGALPSYWDAAFVFNTRYAGLGPQERFLATLDALEFISGMPGLQAAFVAWVACALILFLQAGPGLTRILRQKVAKWIGLCLGLGIVVMSLAAELLGGEPGFGLAQKTLLGGGGVIAAASLLLFFPGLYAPVFTWLEQRPLNDSPDELAASFPLNLPLFAFLYFPAILALLTISGRNYVYYFIPFIPFLMIGFAAVAGALLLAAEGGSRRIIWAFLLAAWIGMAYVPGLELNAAYAGQRFQPLPEIISYVTGNTRPDETILVWGKPSTYVYVLAKRNAPTKYFYQAPVFQEDYNNDFQVSAQILRDVQSRPPKLFLFTIEPPGGTVTTDRCPLPEEDAPNTPGKLFQYICDHYQYEGQVSEFLVFRLP